MPKPFDATLKGMLERGPADWPALAGFGRQDVAVIDADVSTFTGASDKVLRVRGSPDWLLDVNFQRGPDASLPRRMHLYNALLEHRHGLLVRSVALLLAPKAHLSAVSGRYVRAFPGEEPYDDFRYRVIRVWELPVEPLLTGGLGTLPLAPISAVTPPDLPGVVARMKERLTGPQATPQAEELWTAAYVLMGLRYERDLIHHLLRGVLAMEESVTYQEIVEEGIAKGEVREARKTLLLLGTKQFGAPPAEVGTAVAGIHDLERLEKLILRVPDVGSWQELLQPDG